MDVGCGAPAVGRAGAGAAAAAASGPPGPLRAACEGPGQAGPLNRAPIQRGDNWLSRAPSHRMRPPWRAVACYKTARASARMACAELARALGPLRCLRTSVARFLRTSVSCHSVPAARRSPVWASLDRGGGAQLPHAADPLCRGPGPGVLAPAAACRHEPERTSAGTGWLPLWLPLIVSILLTMALTWWAWEDLNFRPLPYQGSALTD
jgi:hypothetical protein